MNLYTVALFVHMMGLIALFGAAILLHNVGTQLRAAATWHDVRILMGTLRALRAMFPSGGLLLLASGMVMTRERWTFGAPWVVVGTTVVVLFAILGGVVLGRGFGGLERLARTSEGPIDDAARARLTSPALWGPTFGMNFAGLGVVWVMSTKPDWAGAVGVPVALAVVGALIGTRFRSRRTAEDRGPVTHGGSR